MTKKVEPTKVFCKEPYGMTTAMGKVPKRSTSETFTCIANTQKGPRKCAQLKVWLSPNRKSVMVVIQAWDFHRKAWWNAGSSSRQEGRSKIYRALITALLACGMEVYGGPKWGDNHDIATVLKALSRRIGFRGKLEVLWSD